MRQEIIEAIDRMTKQDREDVAFTCGLTKSTKACIKVAALSDELVAEYVLQY